MPDQFIDGLDKSTFSADRAPLSRLRSSRFKLATLAAGVGLLALACGSASSATDLPQPTAPIVDRSDVSTNNTEGGVVGPQQEVNVLQQYLEGLLYQKTYSPEGYKRYAAYIRDNTWTVVKTSKTVDSVYPYGLGISTTNFPDVTDLSDIVGKDWLPEKSREVSSNIFVVQRTGTGLPNYWLEVGVNTENQLKFIRVYGDTGSGRVLPRAALEEKRAGLWWSLYVPAMMEEVKASATVRFRDGY